jgi:hypothetical protein
LVKYYLVFGHEEWQSIRRAWEKTIDRAVAGNEPEETAETFLFGLVLKSLSPDEQLAQLVRRPEKALNLVTYEPSFRPIADGKVVDAHLVGSRDKVRLQRALWFLSANAQAIPEDFLSQRLATFLGHEESLVRGCALRILYSARHKPSIEALVQGSWAWNPQFNDVENHWGSLLLSENGSALPYAELHERIHPAYLGYALQCRRMVDAEVQKYARRIHSFLSAAGRLPDLPSDLPPIEVDASDDIRNRSYWSVSHQEMLGSVLIMSSDSSWGGVTNGDPVKAIQSFASGDDRQLRAELQIAREAVEEQSKAGNQWFARQFRPEALDRVIEQCTGLARIWIESALDETGDGDRLIAHTRPFYETICGVLLRSGRADGIQLFWRLQNAGGAVSCDSRTGIPMLDTALFTAPNTEQTRTAWTRRVEQSTTDRQLMGLAIAAQAGNGRDWLWEYTREKAISIVPVDRSRGLALLAFLDTQEAIGLMQGLFEEKPESWPGQLLGTSIRRWQQNAWARIWFRRFLSLDDDVSAWASFRLFLQCIDSRFWLWRPEIETQFSVSDAGQTRLLFLQDNTNTLADAIRKNEGDLREHLFGQKVRQREVWPWM